MSALAARLAAAMEAGRLSSRLWLYSNYHCNLACTYCLTESSPTAPPRLLSTDRMVALARQGKELGFQSIGVTGGEPFLRPDLVSVLTAIAAELPVLVLTNGTLFNPRRVEAMKPLERLPCWVVVRLCTDDDRIVDINLHPLSFGALWNKKSAE